ncbi:winged helix-turn-helix transcriptional regulator [Thalassomonas sp. M1454]|uniref:winged helix-turn-helix transcriptional regulator n=1 Tax=Thalassomonas sp. M1454 TaxID=2594477 RepID=UPI00117C032E|nr:winged helix-turn-helix transcriptional regulator [Thalassomonas sp. M1454]TRX56676.1 helix-turn-helix transcriptional regulator [Thalassomonas sp. M1454]
MEYGQFCPIAKANEILGEKWTLLIIRELLIGGCRFNELQRGLSHLSPTLLSKRLRSLELHGLLIKKRIQGQRGYEYYPTDACQQLLPIIKSLGDWGMIWARNNLTDKDYDVELLMLYLKRSIVPNKLPGSSTIIKFNFTDVSQYSHWWIVVNNNDVDLCVKDPGKDVDVYFTTKVKTMVEIWMGEITYKQAIKQQALSIVGYKALTSNVSVWMNNSVFTGLPSATKI